MRFSSGTVDGGYGPYFDPDFDSFFDRTPPPRVCVDNDTCDDYTLVKVDSANRHGILLEMVQVLTDLDLVISKSYISSDGGWLMDVFHVTDQLGNKLNDPCLIRFIQQSLDTGKSEPAANTAAVEVRTCLGKPVAGKGGYLGVSDHAAALEFTAMDRPGLLSEISAVLVELGCQVDCAQAWTHNGHAASILYLVDQATGGPISDLGRLAHVEEQVDIVVGAHGDAEQRWRVRVSGPTHGRVHTERRLHQLMHEDGDYEAEAIPARPEMDQFAAANIEARRRMSVGCGLSTPTETQVSIDSWKERGYSVVNITSRDRPKLFFDTVCTLTDMEYVVFHAAVGSQGPLAVQEYYIRHADGCTLDSDAERRRLTRCLVAAVERRVSHGLRLDLFSRNRTGLLSDITRVFRENGMTLTRAECGMRGEMAVGTFYVTDASGSEADAKRVEAVREEIGTSVALEVNMYPGWPPVKKINSPSPNRSRSTSSDAEEPRRISLGSLLWSHIERFSNNFGLIRS